MTWNGGQSVTNTLLTPDSYGRKHIQQTRQGPASANWDTVQTEYDLSGLVYYVTAPYASAAGTTTGPEPAEHWQYDALARPLHKKNFYSSIDIQYTYNLNDVLVAVTPAPAGENNKQRQMEYDALGRLTSVCEISLVLPGTHPCGQAVGQNGFWTQYQYDPNGNLTQASVAAQWPAYVQNRTFSYDGLGRLLSEVYPESGATSYVYDTEGTCGSSTGDRVKRVDAAGHVTCYGYDGLHRVTSVTYPGSTNTHSKYYTYDAATAEGISLSNPKGRLVEGLTKNSSAQVMTKEVFSYDARGSATDFYENTPNSGGWYHTVAFYGSNAVLWRRQGYLGTGTTTAFANNLGYVVDGEGRLNGLWDSTVSKSIWGGPTTYNPAGQPDKIAFYSGDSETFSWDQTTGHMTGWTSNVGSRQMVGALSWNTNGTLAALQISDSADSSYSQYCTYNYDDLARVGTNDWAVDAGVKCTRGQQTVWQQTFKYDGYYNIFKTGSSSFTPTYDGTARNNHIADMGFHYDGVGGVTQDNLSNTYSYDVEGRQITVNGKTTVFDALNRAVEIQGSSNTQVVYAPDGFKFAFMNGQSLLRYIAPLAAGVEAVYTTTSSSPAYWRHSDWLGSSRIASTPSQTVYYERAFAPYGEPYGESNATDRSYTGQTEDTATGLYDFLFRQQNPTQGRWLVPDPAKLAAIDLTNPQTWNRYAYVGNNPLAVVDPLGLDGDQPPPIPWGSLFCGGDPIVCALGGWDVCVWAGLCSSGGSGGGNGGNSGGGSSPSGQPSTPPSKPVNFPTETNGIPNGMNVNFGGPLGAILPSAICGDMGPCPTIGNSIVGVDDAAAVAGLIYLGGLTIYTIEKYGPGAIQAIKDITHTIEGELDCAAEWRDARRTCRELLSQPNPPRGLTGGYTNVEDCARGFVSEACGGNAIDWGKRK